jgi:hypothetical protein
MLMTEVTIHSDERVLLGPDEGPVLASELREEHGWYDEPAFVAAYSTGREWEAEETDDGFVTVRTTPDPTLHVYLDDDAAYVALLVENRDDIVMRLFEVPGTSVMDFVARMTTAIDEGYDGIGNVEVAVADGQMTQLGDRLRGQVEDILADA